MIDPRRLTVYITGASIRHDGSVEDIASGMPGAPGRPVQRFIRRHVATLPTQSFSWFPSAMTLGPTYRFS